MSETLSPSNCEGTAEFADVEYLARLGYSFVSPAKEAKRHSQARMFYFDRFDARDPMQRATRTIDVAFYALELSTPLKNYDSAHSALEKLEPEDRVASQHIIDELLIVMKVDEMLARAYHEISSYTYPQLQRLKTATSAFNHKNTGVLTAIHRMASPNQKLGYISTATARHAEDLIRFVISQEKSINLTPSEESLGSTGPEPSNPEL